jgi:hypothetical protein
MSLLVLLGIMLASASLSMTLAGRSARLSESDARLDAAVDFALNSVLSDAGRFALADLPFGEPRSFDVIVPNNAGVSALVTVTRLRDGLLWIIADAWLPAGDHGSRHTNMIARLARPTLLPPAPLVSPGGIDIGGRVEFEADTSITANDADCAAAEGIAHSTTRSDAATFYRTPEQRARLDSAVAMGIAGGNGNIVHVRHDTTIGPGAFEGILIADSALTIVGPMTATGLLIAGGKMLSLSGLSLTGALLSYDSTTSGAIKLDNAVVRYSPCAVARQFRRLFPPRRLRTRSWFEVL